ncbi:MAG: HAD-IA family hydrolase [Rhodospirillales bacterium]|nr:HAD-IA family hydrolase [Rhodospirillales bacterium]MDE0378860.1 HAD-IA family hydrolase [Rhodospirillales bacterium]
MSPSAFRAFTFDCYGTLIDWEQGMLRALRALPGIAADDDALLAAFARHEHAIQEENPAMLYPQVLDHACKAIAADFGHAATDAEAAAFGASIADWPPFPDSVDALAYLRQHGLLMVLSNVDRASFAHSASRLGDPFQAVVTAEDVGSYKPAPAHFERAKALLADEGIAPGEVLHVAQSLFHDVVPGRAAGFSTCWIDRRAGRPGGATPPVDVEPDMTFHDLASLAAWHRTGTG